MTSLALTYAALVGAVLGGVVVLFMGRPYRNARIDRLVSDLRLVREERDRTYRSLDHAWSENEKLSELHLSEVRQNCKLTNETSYWRTLSARSVRTAEFHCDRATAAEAEAALPRRTDKMPAGLIFESEADRSSFMMRTGGVVQNEGQPSFAGLPLVVMSETAPGSV